VIVFFQPTSPRQIRSAVLLIALALTSSGCNRFRQSESTNQSAIETITSSQPPFKTREPARYRATRIITTIVSPSAGSGATKTRKISIARDAGNRREEYETTAGETVVYLENNRGWFVVLPSRRVYADLNNGVANASDAPVDDEIYNSADGMLNRTSVEATYRKLGMEHLHERATTKYSVTYANKVDGPPSILETYIWVDDELGMPIRSEVSYVNSGHLTRVVTELRDISLEVDPRMFEMPVGFKLVEHEAVRELLRTGSRVNSGVISQRLTVVGHRRTTQSSDSSIQFGFY
jgi:hypothetical protein